MKKIISILMIVLMVSLIGVGVFAEGEAVEETPVTEAAPEVAPDSLPDTDTEVKEEKNVFDQVYVYVIKHRNTILEIVALGILLILRRKTNKLSCNIEANTLGNASVIDSQGGVVGAVNTMIDGYNAFKEDFKQFQNNDAERDKQLAAVVVTNVAILEIMSRVFPNSKQLPQGVKDVVNITYANAMKAVNDDVQLAALVSASKTMLAAGIEKAASDEEAV